jgi:hypothetical protein
MAEDTTQPPPYEDRRKGEDRRKSQQPFEGPDRRKGERRTGEDRRNHPRS